MGEAAHDAVVVVDVGYLAVVISIHNEVARSIAQNRQSPGPDIRGAREIGETAKGG